MTITEAIRKSYPNLRRAHMAGIIRNGNVKRTYQCCGCGDTISMSNQWPVTKRVRQFIAEHDVTCGAELTKQN